MQRLDENKSIGYTSFTAEYLIFDYRGQRIEGAFKVSNGIMSYWTSCCMWWQTAGRETNDRKA